MNRAPSPRDTWWADHLKSCGGVFHKIKEPDDYGKPKRTSSMHKKGKSILIVVTCLFMPAAASACTTSCENTVKSKRIDDMFAAKSKSKVVAADHGTEPSPVCDQSDNPWTDQRRKKKNESHYGQLVECPACFTICHGISLKYT